MRVTHWSLTKRSHARSILSESFKVTRSTWLVRSSARPQCCLGKSTLLFEESGIDLKSRLLISQRHILFYRLIGFWMPPMKSVTDQGWHDVGKGIGPTYTDKVSRNGLRVGDILSKDFKQRFEAIKNRHLVLLDTSWICCQWVRTQLSRVGRYILSLSTTSESTPCQWRAI